jgi:2-polyprenyl-3-methyl-5-hydroxy-6-metoxy-1,4-benzoquinol methylase
MLITPEYRTLNYRLHSDEPRYGGRVKGLRWGHLLSMVQPGETILDYGCGKGLMAEYLRNVTNYDPILFPAEPQPHDVLACIDVLEHVEPDCLTDVLAHVGGLTKRLGYFVICSHKGTRTLPDGRLAHLIVKPAFWWEQHLASVYRRVKKVETPADKRHDMTFICEP